MSLTLGEKLRQAREERGISISEVAEQTRISGHYLESIENDDYRTLPGGIFNKGFVKSYAKYVDIDEQEALRDYAQIMAAADMNTGEELKVYKPEVLTDDRHGSSMIPTVIIAVIILGAMTAGLLYLVDYLRNQPDTPPVANTATNANSNANTATVAPTPGNVPEMATLKVEFKATTEPVSLAANSDGKSTSNVVTPGSTVMFEPKESLKLGYSRSLAAFVQLTINGKTITLPAKPLVEGRKSIEFTISRENLAQIWTSGSISTEVPPAIVDANANTAPLTSGPTTTVPTTPKPTPVAAKPAANAAANTAVRPAATPQPAPANRPAGNRP